LLFCNLSVFETVDFIPYGGSKPPPYDTR